MQCGYSILYIVQPLVFGTNGVFQYHAEAFCGQGTSSMYSSFSIEWDGKLKVFHGSSPDLPIAVRLNRACGSILTHSRGIPKEICDHEGCSERCRGVPSSDGGEV